LLKIWRPSQMSKPTPIILFSQIQYLFKEIILIIIIIV
jgi:hypothetical protein